jgi:hypothetical protein
VLGVLCDVSSPPRLLGALRSGFSTTPLPFRTRVSVTAIVVALEAGYTEVVEEVGATLGHREDVVHGDLFKKKLTPTELADLPVTSDNLTAKTSRRHDTKTLYRWLDWSSKTADRVKTPCFFLSKPLYLRHERVQNL